MTITCRYLLKSDDDEELCPTTFALYKLTLESRSPVLYGSFHWLIMDDEFVPWDVSISRSYCLF